MSWYHVGKRGEPSRMICNDRVDAEASAGSDEVVVETATSARGTISATGPLKIIPAEDA